MKKNGFIALLLISIVCICLSSCKGKDDPSEEISAAPDNPAAEQHTDSQNVPDHPEKIPDLSTVSETVMDPLHDTDDIYIGELDNYIQDRTNEMMDDDIAREGNEIYAVCEDFAQTAFTVDEGTGDFTTFLKKNLHEQCRKVEETGNIYPLFQKVQMNSEYKALLPLTSIYYEAGNTLYCKYITSIVYSCQMKYLEKGDYAQITEFDMVKDKGKWMILNYEFHPVCPYDENTYSVHYVPDTKGTVLKAEPNEAVLSWQFRDIDAFMASMERSTDKFQVKGEYDEYIIDFNS